MGVSAGCSKAHGGYDAFVHDLLAQTCAAEARNFDKRRGNEGGRCSAVSTGTPCSIHSLSPPPILLAHRYEVAYYDYL